MVAASHMSFRGLQAKVSLSSSRSCKFLGFSGWWNRWCPCAVIACSRFTRHTSCAPSSESAACLWLSCQLVTLNLLSLSLSLLSYTCHSVLLFKPTLFVIVSSSLSLSPGPTPSCNTAQLWALTQQLSASYITDIVFTHTHTHTHTQY